MTPKVGETRDPRSVAVTHTANKCLISLNFSVLLNGGSAQQVAGPVVLPSFSTVACLERLLEEQGGFARNGKQPEADLGSSLIDPLELSLARPLGISPRELVKPAPATDAATVASIERAVQRLSFGGDRRTGVARIELGGAWAGAVLVVRASGREVRLELELGGRPDAAALAERLAARLRARGLSADVSLS